MYRHRKCGETEIGTGNSDNGSLRDESSGFDRVQRRSNDSRDGKKKGPEVKRELEEKGLSFRNNQGEKHTNKINNRGPLIRSIPSSWSEKDRMIKKRRGRHNKEVQFVPEKAEKGTIVHTSRSEQDQATRMPDEEVINNGKTRKGEERGQRNPCHWRSCSYDNPTPLAHADASRDVLPRGGTSQDDRRSLFVSYLYKLEGCLISRQKSGENASQAAENVNGGYGADTVTRNYVQFWFRRFYSGIFDVKDAPRTGRPVVENVDEITEIIKVDRHVSSHSITQELKVETICAKFD
ncbi:histone-lysine N-methyltransferase SETMAR [Trichonephila clavipes]|nr:histone-lysine N-methyltransferase SETMAR [Trichonephila clavipes]